MQGSMINAIGRGESKDVRDEVTLVVIFASGQGTCGGQSVGAKIIDAHYHPSQENPGSVPGLNLSQTLAMTRSQCPDITG